MTKKDHRISSCHALTHQKFCKNFISIQKEKTERNILIFSYESYNSNKSQCETAPENPSQAVFLSYQQGAVNIPLFEVKISVNRADRPMIEPWEREVGAQIAYITKFVTIVLVTTGFMHMTPSKNHSTRLSTHKRWWKCLF